MAKIEKGKKYEIQPIKDEDYSECPFVFGIHMISSVDGQYFQTNFEYSGLEGEWWDSKGFDIKEIRN